MNYRKTVTSVLAICLVFAVTCLLSAQVKPIPKPENIALDTKDGVTIKCTYFGSNKEKAAVPVILLHGWEGKRDNLLALATAIQKAGHAVIVPDLRGHGASNTVRLPNGDIKDIELDRLRPNDFNTYVTQDMEAVKKFLVEENNKGNLNIDLLTVVSCDFSTIVAINWAVQDWSWPVLPTYKQGQDVKGLVLVSPDASFKGFTYQKVLKHPAIGKFMSVMIIVGKGDSRTFSDAKKLETVVTKARQTKFDSQEDLVKNKDFFRVDKPTSINGERLLLEPRADCLKDILFFINARIVSKASDFPWKDRTNPLTAD